MIQSVAERGRNHIGQAVCPEAFFQNNLLFSLTAGREEKGGTFVHEANAQRHPAQFSTCSLCAGCGQFDGVTHIGSVPSLSLYANTDIK